VTRVLIVAASPVARARLHDLLHGQSVEVVGSTPSVELIGDHVSETAADVLLVDYSGERLDAVPDLGVLSDLPSTVAVVILTDAPAPWSADAVRAGVRGVLASDVAPDQLVVALDAAAAGLIVMHPAIGNVFVSGSATGSRPMTELAEPLTRREREVIQMLAGGLGNKEIASRLAISEHTVKFHVASILGKLGAASRTEAVSLGIRRGIVLL
jgi:two-component system, NarL family, response regulator YdfI